MMIIIFSHCTEIMYEYQRLNNFTIVELMKLKFCKEMMEMEKNDEKVEGVIGGCVPSSLTNASKIDESRFLQIDPISHAHDRSLFEIQLKGHMMIWDAIHYC